MSIFSTIANAIGGFFKKEVPVVVQAFTSSSAIINIVKTFLGTASGQTLEAIFEALLPGTGAAIIAALNEFFVGYGLVSAELTKAPADIAADGFNAIAKLTGNNKILALSNAASIIAHASSNANGGGSTLQQAIVALPLVYNPNILNNVGSAVSTSTVADTTVVQLPDSPSV